MMKEEILIDNRVHSMSIGRKGAGIRKTLDQTQKEQLLWHLSLLKRKRNELDFEPIDFVRVF